MLLLSRVCRKACSISKCLPHGRAQLWARSMPPLVLPAAGRQAFSVHRVRTHYMRASCLWGVAAVPSGLHMSHRRALKCSCMYRIARGRGWLGTRWHPARLMTELCFYSSGTEDVVLADSRLVLSFKRRIQVGCPVYRRRSSAPVRKQPRRLCD